MLAVAVTAHAPAFADDRDRPEPAQIVLNLVQEAWVETDTARVVLQLKTLLTGDDAAEPVVDPKELFAPIAAADWQMTRFQRGQTDTGFEQWVILAEARVPQTALTGIYDRVKDASSRGRAFSVAGIDFTASLAERQATAAALRAVLYARAAAEAEAVTEIFPDRGFQVHRINFAGQGSPQPVMMRAQAAEDRRFAVKASAGGGGGGPSVAERLVMQATVVIGSAEKRDD
jgi:hypothetical protein